MKKNNQLLICSFLSMTLVGCDVVPSENPTNISSEDPTTEEISSEVVSTQEPTSEEVSTQEPTSEVVSTQEPTSEVTSTEQPTTEEPVYVYDENFDFEGLGYNVPQVEQKEELKPYNPTTFDVSSYQIKESKAIR